MDMGIGLVGPNVEQLFFKYQVIIGGCAIYQIDAPVVLSMAQAILQEGAYWCHADAACDEEHVATAGAFVREPIAVRSAKPHRIANSELVHLLGYYAHFFYSHLNVVVSS